MVFEGEHGGRVGGYERGVHGGTAVGQVVGFDEAGVVGGGEEIYPVRTVGGCVATGRALEVGP